MRYVLRVHGGSERWEQPSIRAAIPMGKTRLTALWHNKVLVWVALATGFVLLVPWLAMRFTDEVAWTLLDFVAAGTLVFGAGLVFVLAARTMPKYRAITGIALAVALIYVWVELAVGIFTTWGS